MSSRVTAILERVRQVPFRTKLGLMGIAMTLLIMAIYGLGALDGVERQLYDFRARVFQRARSAPPDFVLLAIDGGSIDSIGKWPWPRRIIGSVLRELESAGAGMIALDIQLTDLQRYDSATGKPLPEDQPPEDEVAFTQQLEDFSKSRGADQHPLLIVPVSFKWENAGKNPLEATLRAILNRRLETPFPPPDDFRTEFMTRSGIDPEKAKKAIGEFFLIARQQAMLDAILDLSRQGLKKPEIRERLLPRQTPEFADSAVLKVFQREHRRATAIAALWSKLEMLEDSLGDSAARRDLLRADREEIPIAPLARAASSYGFVDYIHDDDGSVRSVPLVVWHRGRITPQFGLALACAKLGVNPQNPSQFKIKPDAIELIPPGQSPIRIPVFTRYGGTFRTPIGANVEVPFFGSSNWGDVFGDAQRSSDANAGGPLCSIGWVWELAQARQNLARNRENMKAAYDRLKGYANKRPEPFDENRPELCVQLVNDAGVQDYLGSSRKAITDSKSSAAVIDIAQDDLNAEKALRAFEWIPVREQQVRDLVKGRTVLIGWVADETDAHPTPLHAKCPGVLIHGFIYDAILNRALWTPAPRWLTPLLICCAGLVASCLMVKIMPHDGPHQARGWRILFHPFDLRLSPVSATAIGVSAMIAWICINGWYLFQRHGYVVPMSPPVIALLGVWAAGTVAVAAERFRVVQSLRGYVDKRLMDFLARHPERELFEPRRQEVTICFSDIQGFTTLTQDLGEKMVPLLQDYLSRMVPVIRNRRGVVNKFMGDGIMFFFGAPDPDPDQAVNALHCALEMQAALANFNAEQAAKRLPELTMRCGINTGEAYVGDAGPDEAREYTALGDTTNVASRLESANKVCGTRILVSDSVRKKTTPDQFFFRPVGKLRLRNRKGGIMTYELIGSGSQAGDAERKEAELLQAAIAAYQARAFEGCIKLLDTLDREFGPSKLRDRYRERCQDYLKNGAPADFEGEIIEQN